MIKKRTYDQFGFLTKIVDKTTGDSPKTALNLAYSFDTQRGNLNSRRNNNLNWNESFTYDNLDRLTKITGAVKREQQYDGRGRITSNSEIGAYKYGSANSYRLQEVDLNTKGDLYYQSQPLQKIKYNAYKKPVAISVKNKAKVDFEYGILQNRSHAYYGGNQENKLARKYQKHYSAITPVEIEQSKDGNTKIITYIGGDAYSAPIVHIKQTTSGSTNGYHYLYRDYLGSILAISDGTGTVQEQRQFGAWGEVDKFKSLDSELDFTNETTLLNRGYTGHEHFIGVALIHMNGRMYDAKLGRFLSPDNYIQEPFSTQSFNRFGYVWNNLLKFTDQSGEIGLLAAVLIGAVIGAYSGGVIANDGNYNPFQWDWSSGKTWGYMLGGLVVGGLSGYAGREIAGSGIPMANTAAIAGSSLTNSVGTHIYTGGQTPISIGLGIVSYDFTNNFFGYLGKKGDKWYENLGYGFGALANLSDAVTLFRGGGQNIKVNSAKTTKDDWWGHSSITDEKGNSLLSVGLDSQVQKGPSLLEAWNNSIKGADKGWNTYLGKKGTWSVELNNISTTAINKYASGVTRWDLLLNSCIGHISRVLWGAGVPNIYLFHPHVLNAQLLVRQLGVYSSPYLYQIP